MKKVLVGVDSKTENFWPVIYAVNLAKRVEMRLFVLLVQNPRKEASRSKKALEAESKVRKHLESLISEARSMGTPIEYYIATGSYTEELIRLIQDEEISLLILGAPPSGAKGDMERVKGLLDEIKFRTLCSIEVVHPKNSAQEEIRNE